MHRQQSLHSDYRTLSLSEQIKDVEVAAMGKVIANIAVTVVKGIGVH